MTEIGRDRDIEVQRPRRELRERQAGQSLPKELDIELRKLEMGIRPWGSRRRGGVIGTKSVQSLTKLKRVALKRVDPPQIQEAIKALANANANANANAKATSNDVPFLETPSSPGTDPHRLINT